MKYFLTAFIILLFSSGCTTKNAFSKLSLTSEQEMAVEYTQSGRIMDGDKVEAIYSAIYLNSADKSTTRRAEEFYISMYQKNNTYDLNITMNRQKALHAERLPNDNKYSHLLSTQNIWSTNYIVAFENNESNKLNLQIDIDQFSSGPLSFSKD